jgi:hypothetical protein
MSRKIPDTSREANESNKSVRESQWQQIVKALQSLPDNEAIADSIAAFCPFDKVSVSRRLAEMEAGDLVIRTSKRGITAKGCKAIVWKLKTDPQPQTIHLHQQELFKTA